MKLFRRKLTHIRHPSDNPETLCGRKVLGPPKMGRPVCWTCADLMLQRMNSSTSKYVWTWNETTSQVKEE